METYNIVSEDDMLSNFYECPVMFDGLMFRSAEAAFQSHKSADPKQWAAFCNLSPDDSKEMGREMDLRPDWESYKFPLMCAVLRAKFLQNNDCLKALLATGTKYIIQDTQPRHDNEWGWCLCDSCKEKGIKGRNMLGLALMFVRESLKYNSIFKTIDFRS